jgi:hypothetical protein
MSHAKDHVLCPQQQWCIQQAGGEAMQDIAAVAKDLTQNMAPPPSPINDLSAAMDILNGHHVELMPMQ